MSAANYLPEVLDTTDAVTVASGFTFTEGPLWHPDDFWYFVDLRPNRLHKVKIGQKAELVRNTEGGNGTTFDLQGRLIVCEGDGRKVTRTGADGKVNGLSYKDRVSGQAHHVPLDGVFVQIGLVPNTEWLKGTLELSRFGEIVIDAKGHTSLPGVFAAGDVTTVPFKQIVIAAGEGAKAALSAFDHLIRQPAVPAPAAEAVAA